MRDSGIFVVHRHDARTLHYDVRLELDGVLKSWAVPKGPSLDPAVRRLAIEVEDHPLEYAAFEGTIPEGMYGAGEVTVWDRGRWRWSPSAETAAKFDSAADALAGGKLDFELHGEKLSGRFVLVKARLRSGGPHGWMLIKARDASARPSRSSRLALSLLLLLAAACATAPAPRRSWDTLSPAAAEARPLVSKATALALVDAASDPEAAIQALEVRRLDFRLDRANVESFRSAGAPPEVVLYLELRANAEWRDRVADYESSRSDAGLGWPWWSFGGDGDFFSDFAGPASNRHAAGSTARFEETPGAALRHALAEPPGPEPFPDARLEPPVPRKGDEP